MSLTVSGTAANYDPIPEGTHLAVCNMLVDIGIQFSERFNNRNEKVIIGWELPDVKLELSDGPHSRTITQTYTSSINEGSNLRNDLAAWRGRDFTPAELEAFNLRNIIGTSCLVSIVHKTSNGRTYANIQNVMALPKGMKPGQLTEPPVEFDFDLNPLTDIEKLPKWIQEQIKKSETYQGKIQQNKDLRNAGVLTEVQDDGELPF